MWKLCHVRYSCMKTCSWWLMIILPTRHEWFTVKSGKDPHIWYAQSNQSATKYNMARPRSTISQWIIRNTSHLYIWVNTCPLKNTVRMYAYVQTPYLHKCWHFHPQPSILACSTEVHFRVTDLQQRGIYQIEQPTTWTTKMEHWKPFLNIYPHSHYSDRPTTATKKKQVTWNYHVNTPRKSWPCI